MRTDNREKVSQDSSRLISIFVENVTRIKLQDTEKKRKLRNKIGIMGL
jgi:hypothetical protein